MDLMKITELQKILADYQKNMERASALEALITDTAEELRSMGSQLHTLARKFESGASKPLLSSVSTDAYQQRLRDALTVVKNSMRLNQAEMALQIGVSQPTFSHFYTHDMKKFGSLAMRRVEEYLVSQGYDLAQLKRGAI